MVTLDAGQRYRFCHDIVGEALYDEIGPAECRRLHRLVADRLVGGRLVGGRLLGGRPGGGRVDLLELAWHVSESAEPGETAAVEVLTEAAQHVLSRAPEAAAGFCGRALAVMGENAPQRAGLLALQCRALARASRPAAAVPPGRAALALLPAGDERFRTATAVISSLFWLGRVDDALEVADEQVRAGPARPALHAQRAVLLVFAGRTSEALAEAATAAGSVLTAGPVPGPVAIPGAEPDPGQAPIPGSVPAAESAQVAVSRAEEVVVHCQLAVLNSMLFRHTETVECADWALRASEGSTRLRLQALIVCAWTEALAGLVPDAARRLRLAEQLVGAIDARQVFPGEVTASAATRDALPGELDARHAFFGELGLTKILLHWFGGRWGAALEGIRGVAAELESRHQSLLAPALTAVELEMRTWRGELVIAEHLAAQRAPRARNMASLHAWAVAGFLAARQGESSARHALAAVDDSITPTYICLLLGRLAELELEHGSAKAADRALRQLAEVITPEMSPWAKTVMHMVAGRVHRDENELRRAVSQADQAGLVFDQARAQLALGEMTTDEVAGLLAAHATFTRLGAHGLRRRAGQRLQELGEKVPRARSRAPGLMTESEERVARLVQQGMRNRDIAAALHYSPRSIEVYLSRIYAKLRVSSRLELARTLDAMDARDA